MLDIQIMGLPKNLKKQRLIHLLKNVIFGKKLKSNFWISNIHSSPNSKYIQVSMTISKNADAYTAVELINNFCYFNGNENFQLSAVVVENDYDEPVVNELLKEQVKRDRAARGSKKSSWSASGNGRSRSPLYENESIKLEMEIDLVRRQRLLVEEERKLLLEKKKLQLLQINPILGT